MGQFSHEPPETDFPPPIQPPPKPDETVHHPAHYGGDVVYEPIKFIEHWKFGFHLGNTIKYLVRFQLGKPGVQKIEDLKKARWYLDRKIEQLENVC